MTVNYGRVFVGFVVMLLGIGFIATTYSLLMVLGGFIAGFSMTIILAGMTKDG